VPSLSLVLQAAAIGILTGGLYALMASGLTLYFGVMRVVQIAHPAFILLGAYLTYWAFTLWGVDPLLSMVGTVPLFFFMGMGIQRYLLSRLRPHNMTMMSVLVFFAIALTVEGTMGMLWTGSYRTVNVEYANRSQQILGLSLPNDRLVAFAVAVTAFVVMWALLRYSKWGRALRATVQHRDAARLIGIDVDRTTAIGFGVGLATAAVAGSVLALITTFFPGAHYGYIARLMAIIVIGGLGSVPGAAIAALIMGLIESIALVTMNAVWAALVFYIFLIATLLFRPEGFFGGRLAERF
jgi:branched-chain amino acid transport system permease protein